MPSVRLLALAILAGSSAAAFGQPAKLSRVRAVALSADGELIAAATAVPTQGPGRLTVWDAAGKLLHVSAHDADLPDLAFAPGGTTLALARSDGKVLVSDSKTGQVRQTLSHPKGVRAVAFGKAGRVATAAGDNRIRVWDVAAAREVSRTQEYRLPALQLAFAPDGQLVAGIQSRRVLVWEAATGREVWASDVYAPEGVAFTADSKTLLQADGSNGAIVVLDAATGAVRVRMGQLGGLGHFAYAPAAELVATSYAFETARLHVTNLRLEPTATEKTQIAGWIEQLDADAIGVREAAAQRMVELGPPAERLLRQAVKGSASAEVRLRARKARDQILDAAGTPIRADGEGSTALALSADGRKLAVGCRDGAVRLLDPKTGHCDRVLRPEP